MNTRKLLYYVSAAYIINADHIISFLPKLYSDYIMPVSPPDKIADECGISEEQVLDILG